MANGTSITAVKGRVVLLQIASGASPTTFTDVTGLRTTGVQINDGAVDITTKSSAGWQEMLPDAGVKSVNISASGIWDSANANLLTVQAASLAGGSLIEARVKTTSGDSFTGTWSVGPFTRNAPHDNAETFDLTLRSHGPVYYSAS